jgi:hypothetical protein
MVMKKQMMVLALAATTLAVMAGCKPGTTTSSAPSPDGKQILNPDVTRTLDPSGAAGVLGSAPTATPATSRPATSKPAPAPSTSTSSANGPKVTFTLVQKPKCAEGTAVFRAPAVPAIIKWKITGATSAALSVDDHSHTAGTYGPEPLSGTETFDFGCNGPVGSTEKHTYAIYSVGGGPQRSKELVVTAKVLDNGKN